MKQVGEKSRLGSSSYWSLQGCQLFKGSCRLSKIYNDSVPSRYSMHRITENIFRRESNADQAIIQVTEASFTSCPANLAERVDLGYRQLFAFAMRHFREMPRVPSGKSLLARPTSEADGSVMHGIAELAARLGFESTQISSLQEWPHRTTPEANTNI